MPFQRKPKPEVDESSPIIQCFKTYQVVLDAKHDKLERLVKNSRDVTIESKRIIFALHRIDGDVNKEKQLTEAKKRLDNLKLYQFKNIANELKGEDAYQFLKAYTFGLQEFIEALSFYHYLKEASLISHNDVQENLVFKDENSQELLKVEVSVLDYLLGIADMTGELMRKTIHTVAQGNTGEAKTFCVFLREIHNNFLLIGRMEKREIGNKLWTLKKSLEKVENACYNIQVRGSEIPEHMLGDLFYNEDATEETEPQ